MSAKRKTNRNDNNSEKDLLLRHPNFVAKSSSLSFEATAPECEAGALTTELTAPVGRHLLYPSRGSVTTTALHPRLTEMWVRFCLRHSL